MCIGDLLGALTWLIERLGGRKCREIGRRTQLLPNQCLLRESQQDESPETQHWDHNECENTR